MGDKIEVVSRGTSGKVIQGEITTTSFELTEREVKAIGKFRAAKQMRWFSGVAFLGIIMGGVGIVMPNIILAGTCILVGVLILLAGLFVYRRIESKVVRATIDSWHASEAELDDLMKRSAKAIKDLQISKQPVVIEAKSAKKIVRKSKEEQVPPNELQQSI